MRNKQVNGFFTGRRKLAFGLAVSLLILGNMLMVVKSSDNQLTNSPEIFTFVHITLAPVLLIMGYILVVVSIMITPKKSKQ